MLIFQKILIIFDCMNKAARYERIYEQISGLMQKCTDRHARMATVCAVLHYKMPGFFWTGFYLLQDDRLMAATYQGPVACMELTKNKGVCWKSIFSDQTIIVPDVHQFADHIACDARSKSEIAVPFHNLSGEIIGVLDVDSENLNSFDETDAEWLEKIIDLIIRVS